MKASSNMSESPLVSIITPSYNQAAFLEQTMHSVLEQDYPNIEYLVADGGSDDGSVEIIKRYADRLAWWVSEKDHGQAEAINKGFSRARGEYIAWVNSDDFYLPGAISAAVKEFQQHPEVGLVFGDVKVVDKDEKILNHLHYGNWGLAELMTFHIIGQPAVFLRRSVLEKAGFLDESYHFMTYPAIGEQRPVRFWVTGDTGTGRKPQQDVFHFLVGEPFFILHHGFPDLI